MAIKLTDARLVLILSAAVQRNDRCLIAPEALKEGAKRKFAAKLLAAGLVRETKVKSGGLVWRRDAETGQAFGLKLTSAGVKAVAVNGPTGPETQRQHHESITTSAHPAPAPKPQASPPPQNNGPISASPPAVDAAPQPQPSTAPLAPRKGSKLAQVIDLLEREDGATIAELTAATAWLPHTTRAALTGLRKRGYQVTIDRSDKVRGSAYRITDSEAKERVGGRNGNEASVTAEPPIAEAAKPRKARRAAPGDDSRAA